MEKNGRHFPSLLTNRFVLSPQRCAVGSWTPARRATSPRLATRWSTRLTRTATGSSRRRNHRSASSSTSTRTSRSRGWTASKTGAGPKPSYTEGASVRFCRKFQPENLKTRNPDLYVNIRILFIEISSFFFLIETIETFFHILTASGERLNCR